MSFKASLVENAAIKALVLAMAGIIFLANPRVSIYVTPSILNFFALSKDFS